MAGNVPSTPINDKWVDYEIKNQGKSTHDLVGSWSSILRAGIFNMHLLEVGCNLQNQFEPTIRITNLNLHDKKPICLDFSEWSCLTCLKMEHIVRRFNDDIIPFEQTKLHQYDMKHGITVRLENENNEKSVEIIKSDNSIVLTMQEIMQLFNLRNVINQKVEFNLNYLNSWTYEGFVRHVAESLVNDEFDDHGSIIARGRFVCLNMNPLIEILNCKQVNGCAMLLTEVVNLFPEKFVKDVKYQMCIIKVDPYPIMTQEICFKHEPPN